MRGLTFCVYYCKIQGISLTMGESVLANNGGNKNIWDEFLNAYNLLDQYLHNISGIQKNDVLISYLENVLPPEKSIELKRVREFRNANEHGVFVNGERPAPPRGWIRFLRNMLEYCKNPKNNVGEKVKENYNKSKGTKLGVIGNVKPASPQLHYQKLKSQPKAETLKDYKKSKASVIQERIDGLDEELKRKGVIKSARDGIKSSAKSYLEQVLSAKSREEVDSVFAKYENKFADISKHKSAKKKVAAAQVKNAAKQASSKKNNSQPKPSSGQSNLKEYMSNMYGGWTLPQASPSDSSSYVTPVAQPAVQTSVNSGFNNGFISRKKNPLVWIIPSVVAVVGLIVAIIVLNVIGNWTAWQYFIGVVVCLILAVAGVVTIPIAREINDFTLPALIFTIPAIINFILVCWFKSQYSIVFMFIASAAALGSIVTAIICSIVYADGEVLAASGAVLSVLLLVFGLLVLFANWTIWKAVIYGVVTFVIFTAWLIFLIVFYSKDDGPTDDVLHIIAFVILAVVSIVNSIMCCVYLGEYKFMNVCVSCFSAILGIWSFVTAFGNNNHNKGYVLSMAILDVIFVVGNIAAAFLIGFLV